MKKSLLSLTTGLASLLLVGTAYACSCIQSTPSEHYGRADVVFSGTVTAVSQPWMSQYITYTIDVDQSWKGSVGSTVTLVSHESSATCGFTFQKDVKYLVFAFNGERGIETNLCSGTSEYKFAGEALAWLSSGQSSSSGPNCREAICPDGYRYPTCTADGHVINYFADPCMTHQSSSSSRSSSSSAPFSDVRPNHPQYDAIVFVKTHGIVRGYPDGTFRPTRNIVRAEYVKMLVGSMYGNEEIDSCLRSNVVLPWDVPRGEWFAPYVCVAMSHNIVQGYPDGSFRPGANINVAESAKIFVRTTGMEESNDSGEWYAPYIGAMEDANALPSSYRLPSQLLTRGDMAEMIWNTRVTIEPWLQN